MENIPLPKYEKEHDFSVEDIKTLKNNIENEIDDFINENATIPFEQLREFKQKKIDYLLNYLINKKDHFKHCFQTENGSYYFVLKDGESWRFKKEGNGYNIQPVLKHIFFLDQETFNQIQQEQTTGMFQQTLINKAIKTQKAPAEGLYPFEVIIEGFPDYKITKGENFFTISITNEEQQEGLENIPQFSSGYHLGHKIIQVYPAPSPNIPHQSDGAG